MKVQRRFPHRSGFVGWRSTPNVGHLLDQGLDLTMVDGCVVALVRPMTLKREKGNHFTLGEAQWVDLKDDVDVVLMRQDPPFDMGYITATHLLEHIHPDTFVVNDPAQVRNAPEKLFVTKYPDLMPPTMITTSCF